MNNISKFVIWMCKKFNRTQIQHIITELLNVLYDPSCEIKPKDQFKEDHPHYREFYVDSEAPLTESPNTKKKTKKWETKHYKVILKEYQTKHNKPLEPVKPREKEARVPEIVSCPFCEAPHQYIYFNDGKKRSQLKCKVCKEVFQLHKRHSNDRKNAGYYCPYCGYALYKWKTKEQVTIYKCGNKKCPHKQENLKKLNASERLIQKMIPTHFTINYIYREYHFTPDDLQHSQPDKTKTKVNLFKIHNSETVLGLILSFYVSYALSARKTALLLRQIFKMEVTHQTVLNYAKAAAYYCHRFNLANKGPIDDILAGDETYIKIKGKHHYVWFFISTKKKVIIAYHLSDNRETKPAVAAMKEAVRTEEENQNLTLVTDGNPSYPAGLHFLNSDRKVKIKHIKVVGLENLDDESEENRAFKQIIERLNRTYKHHVKPSAGFNSRNGAMALTTLFVTHYNFLRPHSALNHKTPVQIPELDNIDTIQARWINILKMAI